MYEYVFGFYRPKIKPHNYTQIIFNVLFMAIKINTLTTNKIEKNIWKHFDTVLAHVISLHYESIGEDAQ